MNLSVGPSEHLRGEVHIPPNKSHSFRALIMAGLADGASRIASPAVSNDWMRGIEALEMFGAEVHARADDQWEVIGVGGEPQTPDDVVDCGNSGLILRFFTALGSCCEGYTVLTGDHSLRHIRLCQPVIDALHGLGGWGVCTKGDGHAPVVVRGKLKGGRTEIDAMDSQPVSAILIAASLAEAPSEIATVRPGEKPWVQMTLNWLERCGVEFSNENFERYRIRGHARWPGFDATIPLDWSAAMYPIVAAVITPNSELRVPGVDFADCQGDKEVVTVLKQMGADIETNDDGVVARHSKLKGMTIDCNDFIDQFMLLAVVGAYAEGETVLTNAEMSRHKECDRIEAVAAALTAMGASVETRPDGLVIRGGKLKGVEIDSRNDHRMVMTMAVAALGAEGPTTISDTDCVKKTFPHFIDQMRHVGCDMQRL